MKIKSLRAYSVPLCCLVIVLYTALTVTPPKDRRCPACVVMPSFQGLQTLR
ncbi:hypothetical protein D3C78_474410 [compost metagenome]|jgi:hypothetical protein